jgi:hypothetical protein
MADPKTKSDPSDIEPPDTISITDFETTMNNALNEDIDSKLLLNEDIDNDED